MNRKKIFGLLLMLLAAAVFAFGLFIAKEVREGKKKIHRAQTGVSVTRELTRLTPYTEDVGKIATRPVQKKIKEGRGKVHLFSSLSFWLQVLAAIFFLFGLYLIFSSPHKKNRTK